MAEPNWDMGLGREVLGEGRSETLPWLQAKGRGCEGDFTLLLVVLQISGSEKTLKPRSSCPEGQDKLQHHSSVPGKD